jgi:hypothetical protein
MASAMVYKQQQDSRDIILKKQRTFFKSKFTETTTLKSVREAFRLVRAG